MEREIISLRIKKVLKGSQFLALKEMIDSITDEMSLVADLSLDSIQILELIVGLEKEFGFSCKPDELNLELFNRFGDVINFVENKVNEMKCCN